MKCIFCGKEIRDGSLFCANCGKEAEIVPDYNGFEDDYLKAILEKENTPKQEVKQNTELQEKQQRLRQQKKKADDKKKIIILFSVIGVVCILAIVSALIIQSTMTKNNAQSYDYQVEQAQEALNNGDTDTAISFYNKAIELVPDDLEARFAIADIYMKQEKYDLAKTIYDEILAIDKENLKAYKELILIYEKQDDLDAIISLSQGVNNNEILDLFSEYIVVSPTISEDSGTFEEYIDVKITAHEPTYTIYYTLDGSDPIQNGKRYSRVISLDQMGEYQLKAVCKNDKNIYSEVITRTYTINIPAPDMPIVTPDGGNFDTETKVTVTIPTGCSAYYTWDGTVPTITSTKYTEAITVPEGNNVLAIVVIDDTTGLTSTVYRGNFIYYVN